MPKSSSFFFLLQITDNIKTWCGLIQMHYIYMHEYTQHLSCLLFVRLLEPCLNSYYVFCTLLVSNFFSYHRKNSIETFQLHFVGAGHVLDQNSMHFICWPDTAVLAADMLCDNCVWFVRIWIFDHFLHQVLDFIKQHRVTENIFRSYWALIS